MTLLLVKSIAKSNLKWLAQAGHFFMPTNLACRPLEGCWENGARPYIPEALAFGGKAVFAT